MNPHAPPSVSTSSTAAPPAYDGLAYVLRVQALCIVGTLSTLTMPVWWAAVSKARGWDIVAFGTMNTVNAAANFVIGSALAILLRRLDRRQVLVGCGLLMCAAEVATAFASSLPLFMALRAVIACCVSVVAVLGMIYLGYTRQPARHYGWYTTYQTLAQAAGLFIVPQVAAGLGFVGLQIGLALGGIVLTLLAATLPRYAPAAVKPAGPGAPAAVVPILIRAAAPAVLASIAFGFYTTDFFAYSERFGNARGIDAQTIGTVLAVSTLLGVPASLFVSWLGERAGIVLPVLVGALCGAVAAALLLMPGLGLSGFWVAMCVFSLVWSLLMPYLMLLAMRIDPMGRLLAATQPLRAAAGAALAGLLTLAIAYAGLNAVAHMAIAAIMLCPLLVMVALRSLRVAEATR